MQSSWWQYRQWRFVADMNADGVVSTSDVPLWGPWIFFWPGDAFIALFGGTSLGRFLELSPASFGSGTSAALAAALWLLALGLAFYLPRFFIDIVDPTSRQERRERRAAQRARRRQARLARRKPAPRRTQPPRFEERREPRFDERREPRFDERREPRFEERREPRL
jgi:hypothetical protein